MKSIFPFIYVFIGGGIGSLFRYLIGLFVNRAIVSNLPIATLISNISACVIVALILYTQRNWLEENKWANELIFVGVCGGLSTMSTFSKETFQLIEQGAMFYAVVNIVISLVCCIGVFWVVKVL